MIARLLDGEVLYLTQDSPLDDLVFTHLQFDASDAVNPNTAPWIADCLLRLVPPLGTVPLLHALH